jgi:Tfp pilus tip-associated adhesin PilY1
MLSHRIYGLFKRYRCKKALLCAELLVLTALLLSPTILPAVEISDYPMENTVKSAAPNIMFVFDNSGSMDWEFITQNYNGKFDGDIEYVFDDPGDNAYGSSDSNGNILSGADRGKYKAQWSGYNKLFYNPSAEYSPWPGKSEFTDATAVPSNPHYPASNLFDLTAEYHQVLNFTGGVIVDDVVGTSFEVSTSPAWSISTGGTPYTGGNSAYRYISASSTGHYGKWMPTLAAGDYNIYIHTYDNGNRGTAEYTVYHNSATTTVEHSQSQTGFYPLEDGSGNPLTFTFSGDGTEYVRIEDTIIGGFAGNHMLDAVMFVPAGVSAISIKRAHYYTWDDADGDENVDNGEIYLVNFVGGSRTFYKFVDVDGDDRVEDNELTEETDSTVLNRIKPSIDDEAGGFIRYKTDAEDLQNLLNWYSFYRRRELTAKAAVANAVSDIRRAYIGIYTINSGVRIGVQPVQVESNAVVVDDLNTNTQKISGTWADHNDSAAFEGHQYRATGAATFRWNPYVSATKDFDIYARWKAYSTRDTNAKYTIYYDSNSDGTVDGSDTPQVVYLDQTLSTATWAEAETNGYLGRFRFPAGEQGYVTVSRHGGSTNTYTCADAIRLVPVTGSIEVDSTDQLLDDLYSINSGSSTPLRAAFNEIGKYYDTNQSSSIGSSPIADAADGGECQRNYAIVMTDGYYNGSFSSLGNVDNGMDAPFGDSYSDTLADIAMYYYTTDLSSLDNLVGSGSEGCDQAHYQHMVSYTVSFGVTGSIDPLDIDGDGTLDDPTYTDNRCFSDATAPKPTWPNPGSGDAQKIDDLFHAAVNGRGLFFSASNPEELVDSLVQVITGINDDDASGASVSINGLEGGTAKQLFQTSYYPNWTGDLKAFPVDTATGEASTGEGDEEWSASEVLQTMDWNINRKIATSDGSSGVVFSTTALSTALKAQIHTDVTTANDIIDYIRGKAVSGFRTREKVLGDMIHSAPVYYDGTVFVGANDGALHAFNSATGYERFAFIPHLVLDNLNELADVSYDHKYFVDGTAIVAEVNGDALLVCGLGKGGKGYFALDVTNANSFHDDASDNDAESTLASMFKWEFPTSSDPDMGYSFSTPTVAETYDGSQSVIIGNGYNSANGVAKLLVINADTGAELARISTGVGSSSVPNGLSSPAVVDADNDFIADFVYAGDLYGNLWKFDLTDPVPANWSVAFADSSSTPKPLFASGQPITTRPDVMFHCEKFGLMVVFGTGQYLGDPDASDTSLQSVYGIWDYSMNEDKGEHLGSFDRVTGTLSNQPAGVTLLMQEAVDHQYDSNSTQWRTLSDNAAIWTTDTDNTNDQDGSALGSGVTQYENPAVDTGAGNTEAHVGWYFDLPQSGERVVVDVRIWDGVAIVISYTPSGSLCAGGGKSFLHVLNACTGGRLTDPYLDFTGDDKIDENDKVIVDGDPAPPTAVEWKGLVYTPVIIDTENEDVDNMLANDSEGDVNSINNSGLQLGRFYWIEQ